MILLDGISEVLELNVTSVADIDYSITFANLPDKTEGNQIGSINTVGSSFILWVNKENTKKHITYIAIRNKHASLSNVIVVKKQIAGNIFILTPNITLLPGEVYEYAESEGWIYYAADGTIKKDPNGANVNIITGPPVGLKVKDDYQSGEILADQNGAGAVLTFSFSAAIDLVWITDISTATTNISRCDPFGGIPTASFGIPIFNKTPTPIDVTPQTTTIKIFTPTGSIIQMCGYRRT